MDLDKNFYKHVTHHQGVRDLKSSLKKHVAITQYPLVRSAAQTHNDSNLLQLGMTIDH